MKSCKKVTRVIFLTDLHCRDFFANYVFMQNTKSELEKIVKMIQEVIQGLPEQQALFSGDGNNDIPQKIEYILKYTDNPSTASFINGLKVFYGKRQKLSYKQLTSLETTYEHIRNIHREGEANHEP